MNFEEFIEAVKNEVKRIVGSDYSVTVNCGLKVNRELQSISIQNIKTAVAPSIYLEDYYENYQNGKTINIIAQDIINISNQRRINLNDLMNSIQDYKWVKPRLRVKLINFEKNRRLLEAVPYEEFLDLATIPFVLLSKGEEIMSITVNKLLLNQWGISSEELLKQAKDNTLISEPIIVEKMTDYISHMMLKDLNIMDEKGNNDDREEMIRAIIGKDTGRYEIYIMTNQDNRNGTYVALQLSNLSDLAGQLGVEKLYILPSSIHEILAVPSNDFSAEKLREMVYSINHSEVAEEDFLSDSIYEYERSKNNIKIIY